MLYFVALLLLAIKAVITIQDYHLNSLLYLRGGFFFSLFGQLLLWISLAIQIFDLSTINHSFYLCLVIIGVLLSFMGRFKSRFWTTLQFHYEGVGLVFISFLFLGYSSWSIISSFAILLSSISAGICKLRSPIWSSRPVGFEMFTKMPWCTRLYIRSISYRLSASRFGSLFLRLVSKSVPWIQIISASLLIFSSLTSQLFFLGFFCLLLQSAFSLLLFIIADLSFISQIYFILILTNLQLPFNSSITFDILSPATAYLFLYALGAFWGTRSFLNNQLCRFSSCLGLPTSPFHMFTERNLDGICSYYVHGSANRFRNYFTPLGEHSTSAPICSRNRFDFIYPIGRLALSISNNTLPHYTSSIHREQIHAMAEFFSDSTVDVWQFSWNKLERSYTSKKICSFKFDNILHLS